MSVIPLIEEPDSDEVRELYERLAIGMPGIGVLNIFKVMAHNPRILRDWLRLATPLLTGGLALSPRLREIAILRIAQVSGSDYEFAHHIRIAQQAGLSEEEIASEVARVPEWSREGDAITRTVRCPSFRAAIGLVERVADAAEAADHHPDILIRWRRVTLTLSTHASGGLTARDFAMATQIDGLVGG